MKRRILKFVPLIMMLFSLIPCVVNASTILPKQQNIQYSSTWSEMWGNRTKILGVVSLQDLFGVIDTIEYTKMSHLVMAGIEVTSASNATLLNVYGTGLSKIGDFCTAARLANPDIKCMISLAGGNWTSYDGGNLTTLLADAGLRATLITNLGNLMTTYSLDGVDIDWEGSDVDTQSALYTTFLSELRTAFPTKIISVDMTVDCVSHPWVTVASVNNYVDFVNIMFYDIAPLPQMSLLADCTSAFYNKWLKTGYNPSKLVFGLPVYGDDNASPICSYGQIVTQFNPAVSLNSQSGLTDMTGINGTIQTVSVNGGTVWWSGYDLTQDKVQFAKAWGMYGMMLETADWDAVGSAKSILRATYIQVFTHETSVTLNIPIIADEDDGGCAGGSSGTGLTTFNTAYRWIGKIDTYQVNALARRFPVLIPDGATISTAKITLVAREDLSGTTCNTIIAAVDTNDPAAWSGDLSTLTLLGTTVPWSGVAAQTTDSSYDTPDISTIITTLMGSYSYSTVKHIGLLIYNDSSSNNAYRTLYDLDYYSAPSVLTITYVPPDEAPDVWANTTASITTTTATLSGTLSYLGSATSVAVSFEYGTDTGYGSTAAGVESPLSTTGTFHADITGLDPGTTYHFRTKAVGDSTVYGSDETFDTLESPSFSTDDASSINHTTATLNATLSDLGSATSVVVSFEYGLDTGYGSTATASESPMSGTGTFHADITGLTAGLTYHFRAKVVGDATFYGSDAEFDTLANTTTSTTTAPIYGTEISQFTLMPTILEITPAVILILLLFGFLFSGYRVLRQGGAANIGLLVMITIGLLLVLVLMPNIVNLFYTILTT